MIQVDRRIFCLGLTAESQQTLDQVSAPFSRLMYPLNIGIVRFPFCLELEY